MKYEFETNCMVSIFDENYKFKILKSALMSIRNKEFRGYICNLVEGYNNVAKCIVPFMKERLKDNNIYVYDFWFDFYIKSLHSRVNGDIEVKCGISLSDINIVNLYRDKYVEKLKNDILQHWNKSSDEEDRLLNEEKDFITMFNEIHDHALINHKDIFIKNLEDWSISIDVKKVFIMEIIIE